MTLGSRRVGRRSRENRRKNSRLRGRRADIPGYPARGNISPGNQETWESCGTCRATLSSATPATLSVANPASIPEGCCCPVHPFNRF